MSIKTNRRPIWQHGRVVPIGRVNARDVRAKPCSGRINDASYIFHHAATGHVAAVASRSLQRNRTERGVGWNHEGGFPQHTVCRTHEQPCPATAVDLFVFLEDLPVEGDVGDSFIVGHLNRTDGVLAARQCRRIARDVQNLRWCVDIHSEGKDVVVQDPFWTAVDVAKAEVEHPA